jgi:hypothetical protein
MAGLRHELPGRRAVFPSSGSDMPYFKFFNKNLRISGSCDILMNE